MTKYALSFTGMQFNLYCQPHFHCHPRKRHEERTYYFSKVGVGITRHAGKNSHSLPFSPVSPPYQQAQVIYIICDDVYTVWAKIKNWHA